MTSSNLNADEIDRETEQKLRGDAIGDTLYSESFVVKTLFKFNEFQWNKDFEEDLCFLWDMTMEKDVCDYLFKLSYPSIACESIMKQDENRFIEIAVGILANMFCADCERQMQSEDKNVVVGLLRSDDPLILIQVMRFMKALIYVSEDFEYVTEEALDKITFILANSMKEELLLVTLDTVSKITLDFKIKENLLKGELMQAAIVAYQALLGRNEGFELENQQSRTILINLMQIVSNFCVYVNASDSNRLFDEISAYRNVFLEEISVIFQYYSLEENLIPIPEEFQFYFEALSLILPVLRVNYITELFLGFLKILNLFIKQDCDYSYLLDVAFYLVSVGNVDELLKDLQSLTTVDVSLCLQKVKDSNCDKEFNVNDNFNVLYQKICNK